MYTQGKVWRLGDVDARGMKVLTVGDLKRAGGFDSIPHYGLISLHDPQTGDKVFESWYALQWENHKLMMRLCWDVGGRDIVILAVPVKQEGRLWLWKCPALEDTRRRGGKPWRSPECKTWTAALYLHPDDDLFCCKDCMEWRNSHEVH